MTSVCGSFSPSVKPALGSCSTSYTRPEADRTALIGRLSLRADREWLAELLIDLEEDEPGRCGWVGGLKTVEAWLFDGVPRTDNCATKDRQSDACTV
jgi:hypothetical protein